MKKYFLKTASFLALAAAFCHSEAATFSFDGNIAFHKDVIMVPFTLDTDATNVTVWTDSFHSGGNFDPITAVWRDGALVGQNDDAPGLKPGQTYYDSGLHFDALSAGSYVFSIATYRNWANSTRLSDGFRYDGEAPIALSDWCQPASHCSMGTYWSVHLDGVSDASPPPVPEPVSYAMLLVGLGLLGFRAQSANKR